MSKDKFLKLIDDNYYIIAVFDEDKKVFLKNKKFEKYFPNIGSYSDFAENVISFDSNNSSQRAYAKSDIFDGIIKFELSTSNDMLMLTGTRLSYDNVISVLKHVENSNIDTSETKFINFSKNKAKSYCTFMVDDAWYIKYFSDNVYELLGIENPYLKTVENVFGEEFFSKILKKTDYLDIFNDLCIEYSDKLVVITKSRYGYIIMNVYPYSNNIYNRFEEVASLKYKIEQLESELTRRKKLIDFQKETIKTLNEKVNKCHCE